MNKSEKKAKRGDAPDRNEKKRPFTEESGALPMAKQPCLVAQKVV